MAVTSVVSRSACWALIRSVEDQDSPSIKGGIPVRATSCSRICRTEVTAIRRAVEPALCRTAELWLRLHGFAGRPEIVWEDINLQDMVEEARAELYRAQAEKLRREL